MIEVSPKSTAREMIVDNNVNGGQNINNPNNSFSVSSSMATTVLDTTTDATSSFNNPSCGIPDLELPDRLQVPMAPRALAVHPSGGWFFEFFVFLFFCFFVFLFFCFLVFLFFLSSQFVQLFFLQFLF